MFCCYCQPYTGQYCKIFSRKGTIWWNKLWWWSLRTIISTDDDVPQPWSSNQETQREWSSKGRQACDWFPPAPLSSAKNAELDRRRRFNDTTSINILFSFMASADERITWVEGREIWSGMFKTNNGKQSSLASTWRELKEKHAYVDELDGTLHCDNATIARGIKVAYSIRLSNDHSEMKFIAFSLAFLWLVVSSLGIIGHVTKNTKIGPSRQPCSLRQESYSSWSWFGRHSWVG